MLEYLKYKAKRFISDKTKFTPLSYPIFYEQNGLLIQENQDGRKYEITLGKDNKPQIIREIFPS